ncbi:thioredoxin domain-containing protein [Sediminicola luteus]|uniref:Spermatogenesis-associated protein 20-like TRX domain-containing protein n=1 Tax=Sediminicola luteus TaxID=319238 RepID=A0A2A4G5J3_9FLAO|nr:thioredoxin domain-containing protein [Sediminicola luteus]PCE63258.1 hypothetical protein B7P33_13610 [Sediminicola luteus]
MSEFTNELFYESSPYLKQHAHNPVDWKPWSEKTLAMARRSDKPLLISIGYSSCHWCHVMEHECFADMEVAELMNHYFVNIKVDREERPDVDRQYMEALQLMSGQGGWPLNIIALPDGRAFWGATYVNKTQWLQVLEQLGKLYKNDRPKVEAYAQKLAAGLKQLHLIPLPEKETHLPSASDVEALLTQWRASWDTYLGGFKRAPKFMMPVNLDFLLHLGTVKKNKTVLEYVHTTLERMALGGIYDHVGGGFSRYSVDIKWHIPHFEKMLYDNAQLVSLYAKAFAASKNPLYKKVVEETLDFLDSEFKGDTPLYYSALDADSMNKEGKQEEGAYYVWTKEELQTILKEYFSLFADYYNINAYGHWEAGNYVLILDTNTLEIAEKYGLNSEALESKIRSCLAKLKEIRDKRPKPFLDQKALTSWNAMMVIGLCDASRYLEMPQYQFQAQNTLAFIEDHLLDPEGQLLRTYMEGNAKIPAYLEDYAWLIQAYLALYEVCFDTRFLEKAKKMADQTIDRFLDTNTGLFYYNQVENDIIPGQFELEDNVIPSSNAVMAHGLKILHHHYPNAGYGEIYQKQLQTAQQRFSSQISGYPYWWKLVLLESHPYHEIVISGEQALTMASEFSSAYLPQIVLAASTMQNNFSLFENRFKPGETYIYHCTHGSCAKPEKDPKEVLEYIR